MRELRTQSRDTGRQAGLEHSATTAMQRQNIADVLSRDNNTSASKTIQLQSYLQCRTTSTRPRECSLHRRCNPASTLHTASTTSSASTRIQKLALVSKSGILIFGSANLPGRKRAATQAITLEAPESDAPRPYHRQTPQGAERMQTCTRTV